MKILAIESSCDETSAAVLEKNDNQIIVLSNITATSLQMHATTGGIIPENAARMQVRYILPVIVEALCTSQDNSQKTIVNSWKNAREILKNNIDAIAVTYGPGLIGSLIVGVETAKTLAYIFDKPIVPVNHLLAHIYANFINKNPKFEIRNSKELDPIPSNLNLTKPFPFIGLIVSGGHTDLLLFKNHGEYQWLGGTRDDAAGEAFDKIGRLLGLSYPAGPDIEHRAGLISQTDIKFHSPIIGEDNFDFSFSGLKSEAMRFILKNQEMNEDFKNQICYATQKAIVDVLLKKTLAAAEEFNCSTIIVGGGVSANGKLKQELQDKNQESGITVIFPEKEYCTDNAAMIGAYALLNPQTENWHDVNANPELYFA